MQKVRKIGLNILLAVLLIAFSYKVLPVISLRFAALWIIAALILALVSINVSGINTLFKQIVLPLLPIIIFALISLFSTPMFRSSSYKSLLPKISTVSFTQKINPIDPKQLPTVNAAVALNLADKVLGQDATIGSKSELGDLTLQSVNGKMYYVAPLLHSGFMKWLLNDGTPGYVIVSATDQTDVRLVTTLNGQPLHIKYQTKAFFNDYVYRKAYYSGNMSKGLTDATFEIDNSGRPFWTISTYDKTIGTQGAKVTGVVTVDAQTGNVSNYNMTDIPKWIDRVQPYNIVENHINSYGDYIHGFFNFDNSGKFSTSSDLTLVYDKGNCYYYSGLTSVGKDTGTIGFILVNSRTEQPFVFNMSGASEKSAEASAEGKVQNLGYKASPSVLVNVDSIPTYFTTLNDKNNLTKLYAMVSVKDYNVVGTGDTLQECKNNYLQYLSSSGGSSGVGSTGISKSLTGTVDRIGSFTINSTTYFNFTLKEAPGVIYTVASNLDASVPVTEPGDSISISYVDIGQPNITVNSFSNTKYGVLRSTIKTSNK
ncbi:hypothetical protein [Clostridium akagii]|uniref:hypothetical protein n=1 Tax=Clostridium akagii TaxID=91623 RepID=UPI0004796ACE|nr:hypothetical protein [Clostridium akagii]